MFQLIVDAGVDQGMVRETVAFPTIGAFFVVAALLVVVFVAMVGKRLRKPEMRGGMTPERVRSLWSEIEATGKQGTMGAKLAILEADKLLDSVLKSLGFPGETMGERLKTAQYKHPALQQVWPAHKLRNQLAHDVAFELTPRSASQALHDFRAALRTLRVL